MHVREKLLRSKLKFFVRLWGNKAWVGISGFERSSLLLLAVLGEGSASRAIDEE